MFEFFCFASLTLLWSSLFFVWLGFFPFALVAMDGDKAERWRNEKDVVAVVEGACFTLKNGQRCLKDLAA